MQARDESGTVRSVERALSIVELLGEHDSLGLEELHYLTGLPKATVSRLLHTLQDRGWLYRGLCDRRYRLSARRLFGDPELRFSRHLVEQASPLLKELSEHTGLVTDLSSFDGQDLLVVESSVPEVLRKRYPNNRLVMGLKASLFYSAMGKACLRSWTRNTPGASPCATASVATTCCASSSRRSTRALASARKAPGSTRCACPS